MEEPEDKRLLVRFPRELADQLATVAEKERRSINAQIVYFLERAIAGYQRRQDRETLDDAEGITIPGLVAA